jgi:inner membrane protein involved in colicin E2 resistance
MTVPRLLAVIGIFFCTMIAWFILGGSIAFRTNEKTTMLGQRVEDNWGGEHVQLHPMFYTIESVIDTTTESMTSATGQTTQVKKTTTKKIRRYIETSSGDVTAGLKVDYRQKGLLWYSVYQVQFKGDYRIKNHTPESKNIFVEFNFPSVNSIYDNFSFTIDGKPFLKDDEPISTGTEKNQTENSVRLGKIFSHVIESSAMFKPNEEKTFSAGYTSQGTGIWKYSFGETTKHIRNFQLKLNTQFKDYNIPEFCISPTEKTETPEGWNLVWKYSDMISNIKIGVDMPKKLNPGPVAERISFFAPVSLLFFFTILMIIGAIRNIVIHPMNYFFLAAAFFAFHLFFAYLVDHLALEWSFLISAVTSVLLVLTYMRLFTGMKFTMQVAVPSQIIYLILFSYSFFFEGYTGLTITIGAIITLFVMMQITAKINWADVFAKK